MADNVVLIVTFVASVLALISCSITVSLFTLYFSMKGELNKELKHLKEERDACKALLKNRSTHDG